MNEVDKGMMVRTMDAVGHGAKERRMVVLICLASTIVLPIALFIVLSTLEDIELWMKVFLPVVVLVSELGSVLFLQYLFSQQDGPIVLHSNGIEFPRAWVHRLMGRRSFLPGDRIVEIEALGKEDPLGITQGQLSTFTVKSDRALSHYSGTRNLADVQALVEYARKNWMVKVVEQ